MPDAVIVPGGGVSQTGILPPSVIARFDKAMEAAAGAPIIALSAGSPHKRDVTVFESVAGAEYLLSRGYPKQQVLFETASYDTIGNAYFVRTIHTDPAGFRDLCVITSDFHMPRTEAIFRWVFGATPAEPAYRMSFIATPSAGLDGEALRKRREKEQNSLNSLLPVCEGLRTLAAIHEWLFSEHEIYAAGLTPTAQIDPTLLRSY